MVAIIRSEILSAFNRVERVLIEQIIKSLANSTPESVLLDGDINRWRASQLKELNEFRKRNRQYFGTFNEQRIKAVVEDETYRYFKGGKVQAASDIRKAIDRGLKTAFKTSDIGIAFAGVNSRKMRALYDETATLLTKAGQASALYAERGYSKIIFDAENYFYTGTGTLSQAVDMASKDFLSNGIASVTYRNGRSMDVNAYAEMVLRTNGKQAYLLGEGEMREEYGLNLVIVGYRGTACPKCLPFVGKVFYDDVYGGDGENLTKYPSLSEAVSAGLYHPNCKDSHTTYFEGITTVNKPMTREEQERASEVYEAQQKRNHCTRQIKKYGRLRQGSVSPENIERYRVLEKKWTEKRRSLIRGKPHAFM